MWAPKFKSTSRSRLRDNLIAYYTANQADIGVWARSELGQPASPALPPLTNFYKSSIGRILTTFPHAMCVSATSRPGRRPEDTWKSTRHTFLFEFEITGTDADLIQADAEAYAVGLESAALNIPEASLMAGVGKAAGAEIETSVDPDVLRGQSTTSPLSKTGQWYMRPQVTVTVELIEGI